MASAVVRQLADGAEAPGDTDRLHACMGGSEHVDTRVAHVECRLAFRGGLLADDVDDGGVGLEREPFALAEDEGEADVGEEMADELLGGLLILVRSNCGMPS